MEICGKLLWKTSPGEQQGHETDPPRRGWPEVPSCGERPVRACSACTGDYEDPDHTVWRSEEQAGAVDEEERSSGEGEFPVREA